MTERERLPNRRFNESFDFEWRGMHFTATIGRFPDGRLAEIFLTNGKVNTDADTAARTVRWCARSACNSAPISKPSAERCCATGAAHRQARWVSPWI